MNVGGSVSGVADARGRMTVVVGESNGRSATAAVQAEVYLSSAKTCGKHFRAHLRNEG